MQEIITIPTSKLYERAKQYMEVMCGLNRGTKRAEKSRAQAEKIWDQLFAETNTEFLVMPFPKEYVTDKTIALSDDKILNCTLLDNIATDSVRKGFAFLFHSPMPDLSAFPVSEMYLADSWETCIVDAGRDVLRTYLLERETQDGGDYYITDTLAPGMFGIPAAQVKSFFDVLDAARVDITLLPSGMMAPVKSFAGIYLLLDQQAVIDAMDCGNCLSGHKHCEYCQNYAKRYMQ
ncbi:MAG: hypothetical protein ACI4PM_08195 [Butyricicoccus sp.]